ncbi:MAG: B12-binding domain-containing radical SAM protein [Candidatus Omnitrophica bacterium]|nr:B12-binding domain-containing radical SAM protein [Candidatus Omnitrophota bacterium]
MGSKKKIALINIRISDTVFMPLGLLSLGAVLQKEGFQVKVFDPFTYEHPNRLLEEVRQFSPRYIGFSIVTPAYQKSLLLRNALRILLPDAIYFAGGIHPTIFPERVLQGLDLSFVVKQEGEVTLKEALLALESGNSLQKVDGVVFKDDQGVIVANQDRELVENLDTLPSPARYLVDMEKYFIPPGYIRGYFLQRVANILIGRGCPMSCIFCDSHLLFGRRMRKRSVGAIMSEIDTLVRDYRVEGVYFSDEMFPAQSSWLDEFCLQIQKRDLPWGAATRVDFINEDAVRKMKNAGCVQLDVGVESGSDRILEIINKQSSCRVIERAFGVLRKYRMRSFATVMIGNPEETYGDIEATRRLLKSIRPSYIHVTWFTPYPGTEAYLQQKANNDLSCELFENAYDFITSEKPVINLTALTDGELACARATLGRDVFFSNLLNLLTLHNLRYICEAVFFSFLSPRALIKAVCTSCKNRSVYETVYFIFYNYQRYKSALNTRIASHNKRRG